MNEYIKQVHQQHREAAENVAQKIREASQVIRDRWDDAAKKGHIYTRAQREADSATLDSAVKELAEINKKINAIEDDELAR